MGLMSLPVEILERIVLAHNLLEVYRPVFVNPPHYTRVAVPNVDSSQVDVKTSWHVPIALWQANRRLRKISQDNIAISMRLEEEKNISTAFWKLKLDTWVLPRLGLRLNLGRVGVAKICFDTSTFERLEALVKFANGEIEQLLKSATHIRTLILEGIPDVDIFLDRFCWLLADAQQEYHIGTLDVQILGADWKQSSLERVACATTITRKKEAKRSAFR